MFGLRGLFRNGGSLVFHLRELLYWNCALWAYSLEACLNWLKSFVCELCVLLAGFNPVGVCCLIVNE